MGVSEQSVEVKKLQSELLQERERYSVLLSMNSDCLFEYDLISDTIIFSKNNVFSELDGRVICNVKNTIRELNCIDNQDRESFAEFLASMEDSILEFRYLNEDGSVVWCSAKGVMIYDEENNINFITGCICNIDEQKKEKEKLIEQTRRDSLTKLYNKIYTQTEIENYLGNDGKSGTHALMIIDIDNFKKINDNLGHLFGDAVLTNIAENLSKMFYETDILGRIGGDEFLVLLKNTNDIFMLKEKAELVSRVFVDTYTGESKELKITCSMGMALYPMDGKDFLSLFKNADIALYQAKYSGKGCCVLYDKAMIPAELEKKAEYYNKYSVQEERQDQQITIDSEITAFAFDIMAKTFDVNSSMNMLADQIGKKFNAGYVSILERVGNSGKMKSSYLWTAKNGPEKEEPLSSSENSLVQMESYMFDKRGLCVIDDVEQAKCSGILRDRSVCDGVKAVMLCAFFDDGLLKGCVCVADNKNTRSWTKKETDSLYTVTKIISFYLQKQRVSERIQEKLDILMNYDSLTGLSSLHKFKKDALAIVSAEPDRKFAIAYLDISNFKYINDNWGYEIGDQLLCELSEFLSEGRFDEQLVSRVSADNFILLIPYHSILVLRNRILDLCRNFSIRQRGKSINKNIILVSGICAVKPTEKGVLSAIDNANIARKYCKGSSVPTSRVYDEEMENMIRKEEDLTNSMEEALKNNEFIVYLQPKVGLRGSNLAGAEALVRWQRADGVMLPPNDFIPLFEKNGFILDLDNYVYEVVCKMLRKWMDEGIPVVTVSINVSRVHLNDTHFVDWIQNLADRYQIPYSLLELELTESIFLDNTQIALSIMKEFRNLGFGVSIDDFGAGYSSLNLLKDMTTDVLKLDKEFFRQGDMQKEEQIIVSSIISMAKKLNMKVLSEGVETQMQSDFLKAVDCDMVQGYLYEKPMPMQDFEALLKNLGQTIEPKAV